MAFEAGPTATNNIDPALQQQRTLPSSSEPRDDYHTSPNTSFSPVQPIQPSPNGSSFQGIPPTPVQHTQKQQAYDSPIQESSPRGDNDPNDTKRPRACEACRGLKVKCEFDDAVNPDVCKRCSKAGRQCIVTAPSRKRQKKTDGRVAELEKKIDALTATLAAQSHSEHPIHHSVTRGGPVRHGGYPDPWDPAQLHTQSRRPAEPDLHHGVKRRRTGDYDYLGGELHKDQHTAAYKTSPTAAPHYAPPHSLEPRLRYEHDDALNVDVVGMGVVDVVTAQKCFDRYVNEMCGHVPIVVFPRGTRWDDLRKSKPILFLAVLAVAAGTVQNDLQSKLITKTTKILGDRIVHRGEKSLEIVQAIQCITTFYQPPEKYEELNFNQLIHIAAVMALDIGMGKRFKKGSLALWRPYADSKRALDLMNPETRRCWLGCYFMCANSAMSLRRPLLVRWNFYADECVDILQNSEHAAPTDKWLCFLVRGQHISEDIGLEFSMDDPASQVSLTDHKTQYHLKAFERQLEEWERSATPEMLAKPIMRHMKGIINLYMHEIAMHHNHNIDDFKPPFNATPIDGPPDPDFVTPAHIESLTTCMKSVHDVFEAFLSMDVQQLRNLPTLFFVRNSYAAVALIKMYTAVSAKGSKFGSIISTEDLKVDHYLDRLIDRLARTAEDGMCKVAHKFSIIFNMLKQWHTRRTDLNSNSSDPFSRQRTPCNPQQSQQQLPQQGAASRSLPQHQHAYQPNPPSRDTVNLTWPMQQPHGLPQPQSQTQLQHSQQPRTGLQMLSEAAMNPSVPQHHPPPPPSHSHSHSHLPSQQQQQQQLQQPQNPATHWLPPPQLSNTLAAGMNPSEMQDPDMMGYAGNNASNGGGGVGINELGDLDLSMMAYGFGDEFVAMGFGMGMGPGPDGGWGF